MGGRERREKIANMDIVYWREANSSMERIDHNLTLKSVM